MVRESSPSAESAVFVPSGLPEIIHRRVNGCTAPLEPCSVPVSCRLAGIDARLTRRHPRVNSLKLSLDATNLGFLQICWIRRNVCSRRWCICWHRWSTCTFLPLFEMWPFENNVFGFCFKVKVEQFDLCAVFLIFQLPSCSIEGLLLTGHLHLSVYIWTCILTNSLFIL